MASLLATVVSYIYGKSPSLYLTFTPLLQVERESPFKGELK